MTSNAGAVTVFYVRSGRNYVRVYCGLVGGQLHLSFVLKDGQGVGSVAEDLVSVLRRGEKISHYDLDSVSGECGYAVMFAGVDELIKYLRRYNLAVVLART